MDLLLKFTIAVTLAISVLIRYIQFNRKTPTVPITWPRGYWARGAPKADDTTIRNFKIDVTDRELNRLKFRLEDTRFAESLEDGDFRYGFQTTYLKEVVSHWKDKYDWRKHEAILNSFPQFKTQIQGIDIHFIHSKPKGNVTGKPLIIVHGWPGSVWEFYKILPMLTDPVSHGGQPEDAFEVIAPSIPGYGFSDAPQKKGFDQADTARIFFELMQRLGFQEFYVQGGDWGSMVATFMTANYPRNVLGVHLNMYSQPLFDGLANVHYLMGWIFPSLFYDRQDAELVSKSSWTLSFVLEETGYLHIQATKPDTVGTALTDSPAGLAAYILEKFSTGAEPKWRELPDGGLTRKYTLDELLTNVMIYWLNGNIMSSQRYYKEMIHSEVVWELDSVPITVPTSLASFPSEMLMPKAIAEYKFKNIKQFTVMPRGGHFAALEEPQLLVDDIRSFVRKVAVPKSWKKKDCCAPRR